LSSTTSPPSLFNATAPHLLVVLIRKEMGSGATKTSTISSAIATDLLKEQRYSFRPNGKQISGFIKLGRECNAHAISNLDRKAQLQFENAMKLVAHVSRDHKVQAAIYSSDAFGKYLKMEEVIENSGKFGSDNFESDEEIEFHRFCPPVAEILPHIQIETDDAELSECNNGHVGRLPSSLEGDHNKEWMAMVIVPLTAALLLTVFIGYRQFRPNFPLAKFFWNSIIQSLLKLVKRTFPSGGISFVQPSAHFSYRPFWK